MPEKDWLTGDALGWQGAWGTTYPPNLRTFFQSFDDKAWIAMARTREFKPPMPTPAPRAMTDDDLRAIARYVRSLGPAGPGGQRTGRHVPGAPEMTAPRRRASDVPRTTGAPPRPRPHSERAAADTAPTPSPSTSRPKRKPRFVL